MLKPCYYLEGVHDVQVSPDSRRANAVRKSDGGSGDDSVGGGYGGGVGGCDDNFCEGGLLGGDVCSETLCDLGAKGRRQHR